MVRVEREAFHSDAITYASRLIFSMVPPLDAIVKAKATLAVESVEMMRLVSEDVAGSLIFRHARLLVEGV